MPRGFSERERELIRKQLLDEGYKLFSAHGLRKATVEEIAQAASISKGAFYLFFESKEALFLEVAEVAERRFRQEVLAAVDRPGPSLRARLIGVLGTAIALFRTIPLLRAFGGADFELLLRRVSPERLQAHLEADRLFFEELVARCREVGIPIRAGVEELRGLLYALVLVILHEDDAVLGNLGPTLDVLVELTAAYCLGEVEARPGGLAEATPSFTSGGSVGGPRPGAGLGA